MKTIGGRIKSVLVCVSENNRMAMTPIHFPSRENLAIEDLTPSSSPGLQYAPVCPVCDPGLEGVG